MTIETFILCAFGGLAFNIIKLMKILGQPNTVRPDFKDWAVWLPFISWPVLAIGLGYVYSDNNAHLGRLLSLHIGLSAPLIFERLMTTEAQLPAPILLTDSDQ